MAQLNITLNQDEILQLLLQIARKHSESYFKELSMTS